MKLANRPALRELNVCGCGVTAEGVKTLAKSLPKCRIESDRGVIEATAKEQHDNPDRKSAARSPVRASPGCDSCGTSGVSPAHETPSRFHPDERLLLASEVLRAKGGWSMPRCGGKSRDPAGVEGG